MTDHEHVPLARLVVKRAELLDALRSLGRTTRPAKAGEAVLSSTDGQLEIAIGGAAVSVASRGTWPGECRVPGSWVSTLQALSPATDQVTIQVEGGRLHFGPMSVPCSWQQAGAAQVAIPVGARFVDVLALGLAHDDSALEASGIMAQVQAARERRHRIVERAVALFAPLHLEAKVIEAFIDEQVRRATQR